MTCLRHIVGGFAFKNNELEWPALPDMWIATPSASDPSQAPAGQDSVYLYPPAMPVAPRGGGEAGVLPDSQAQAVGRR